MRDDERFLWQEGDVEIVLLDHQPTPPTKSLKAAPDPRDEAERRLMSALETLFANLLPDVAARLAKGEMPSDEELQEAFRQVIQPELVEMATEEFLRLGVEVGVQFGSTSASLEASTWARSYSFSLVKDLTATTRQVLQEALSQFHATPGMTRAQLEALISSAFSPARASLIAQTEVTRSASAATNLYMSQMAAAGITMQRIWNSNNDMKVCPLICAPLHQKSEAEWKDRYPDGPPAHPGCRCQTVLQSVE